MSRRFLITGGAGFIGSNLVSRLLRRGEQVTVYDNLGRSGSRLNLQWLRETYGDQSFDLVSADVRDAEATQEAAKGADVIVPWRRSCCDQFCAPTAPGFRDNALGILTCWKRLGLERNPIVLYALPNKVYGGMENVRWSKRPRLCNRVTVRASRNTAGFSIAVWLFQRDGRPVRA